MRVILLVIAVLVLLWLLRRSWRGFVEPPSDKPPHDGAQPMLACAHCGLHLPRDEALPGRGGVFCGDAHRAAYEQAHPEP